MLEQRHGTLLSASGTLAELPGAYTYMYPLIAARAGAEGRGLG